LNGSGIRTLEDAILRTLDLSDIGDRDLRFLSNNRQTDLVIKARNALKDARTAILEDIPTDIYVTDLTDAWNRLGDILGETPDDALLDTLFSRFCLGK
jgi:tRNA modification GTPase